MAGLKLLPCPICGEIPKYDGQELRLLTSGDSALSGLGVAYSYRCRRYTECRESENAYDWIIYDLRGGGHGLTVRKNNWRDAAKRWREYCEFAIDNNFKHRLIAGSKLYDHDAIKSIF